MTGRPDYEALGARAREMKAAGHTVAQIAATLGVAKKTAYRRVNPSYLRNRARRAARRL